MKTVTFAAPFNPLRWFDKGTCFFLMNKQKYVISFLDIGKKQNYKIWLLSSTSVLVFL